VTRTWIVDGNNVMGARPDGWWHNRTEAMGRLVRLLNDFRQATGDEVIVVFDGRIRDRVPGVGEGVSVRFGDRSDRDPADAEIADLVEAAEDAGSVTVVTSDRALAEIISRHGAGVVGAGEFR
jgi:predicted RNA-binding protein with PIN domain